MISYRNLFFITGFIALLVAAVFATTGVVSSATVAPAQSTVYICLPTTGSQNVKACEAAFDASPPKCPVAGQVAKRSSCTMPSNAPACTTTGGQGGRECYCRYDCGSPAVVAQAQE